MSFVRIWRSGGYLTRGCMIVAFMGASLIVCSVVVAVGQLIGLVPDYSATQTAEARQTAAILALTPSATPQPTATQTTTPTPTSTHTPSPTMTPTHTLTPSATFTPSNTPTITPTFTASRTPTSTYTPSLTMTPTDTLTPSATFTPSNTPTITPTFTASRTPTSTLTRTVTATPPAVTPMSRTTFYAISAANLRSCPRTTTACAPVDRLSVGDTITVSGSIQGETVGGSFVWYVTERAGRTLYIHSSVVSKTRPASGGTSPSTGSGGQPSGPVVGPTQFTCPRNCTEAVNMGLTAQQAAACGLDRDGDGVACYGD